MDLSTPCTESIGGGGTNNTDPTNNTTNNTDDLGKKRKHCNISTNSFGGEASLFKAYGSTSSDEKISLVILKQPEKQHRARYHTEGSRGAVKDRGQNGFPTVQLRGYDGSKTAILQVFVGSDTGTPIPHLYYQACKVSGKNSTQCREIKKENTDVIMIDMDPDKERIVVCDCVGILKERHSDIEGKIPPNKRVNWKKKTTKCRLVYRTEIENSKGQREILQVVTDTICCTQLPGTPEILKMSLTSCSIEGGEELWIIGKNFLKDTEVVFKEDRENSIRPVWMEKVKPIKEFFSNNHLIVNVPPYRDPNSLDAVVVNITVKCGSKFSEPRSLTLKPAQPVVKLNGVVPGTTNRLAVVNLSNGSHGLMTPTLVAMQCKEEPTTVFNNNSTNISGGRPTILEHIEEHIKDNVPHVHRSTKKRRERKTPFSRAREQPDINADEAMFDTLDVSSVSSSSLDRSASSWTSLLNRHKRQTSADRIQPPGELATANNTAVATAAEQQQQQSALQQQIQPKTEKYRQQLIIPDDTNTASLINTSIEETQGNSNNAYMDDDASNPSSSTNNIVMNDKTQVTSPTSQFGNLSFHQVSAQEPLSFAGISQTGFKSAQPTYTTVHRGSTTNVDSPPTTLQPPEAVVQQQQQQQNAPQPQSVVSWVTTTVQDNQSGLQPNPVATTNWDSAKISSDTNAAYHVYEPSPNTNEQLQQQPQNNQPQQQAPSQPTTQQVQQQQSTQQPQTQQAQNQQQQTQQQITPQQQPKQPENSCSLGIDNSGTDSATISIKLPPSVLQDQKQLSTIVNTISKALHQPSATDTTSTENNSVPVATNAELQQQTQPQPNPAQQFSMNNSSAAELQNTTDTQNLIGAITAAADAAVVVANQNWQTTSNTNTQQQQPNVVETKWEPAENDWNKTNTTSSASTWLDTSDADDNGFEQKRQRVSSNTFVAPVDPVAPASNPVDNWTTSGHPQVAGTQNVVQQQQQKQQQNTPQPQSVVSWVTTTVQDNPSGLQPNPVGTPNWDSAKISSDANASNKPVVTANNTGWTFSEKVVENSVSSSVNLSENSNDSGKCTKWENINPKPIEPWSNTAAAAVAILNSNTPLRSGGGSAQETNSGGYGAPTTTRQGGAGPSENSSVAPPDLSQLSTSNVIAAAAAESLQWPAQPNGTSGAGAPLSTSNVIAAAAAESLQWPNPSRPATNGTSSAGGAPLSTSNVIAAAAAESLQWPTPRPVVTNGTQGVGAPLSASNVIAAAESLQWPPNNNANTAVPKVEVSQLSTSNVIAAAAAESLQWPTTPNPNPAAVPKVEVVQVSPQSAWTTAEPVSSVSDSYTSPADSTWTSAESKSWSNAAEQAMDSSSGLTSSVVSAEMMPVNPKEVSPMDVDDILRVGSTSAPAITTNATSGGSNAAADSLQAALQQQQNTVNLFSSTTIAATAAAVVTSLTTVTPSSSAVVATLNQSWTPLTEK